jgi:glycosyltransferase involved in cell wall biosynthesis
MLRRVVVISDLSVERDGPTAIALASVRMLRRNGIEVTYVCGDDGRNPALQELGVRVVSLGGLELVAARPINAVFSGLYNSNAAKILRNVIRETDEEGVVYHLHNWSKILSPSVFGVLGYVSERLFISTHDFFLACPNGGYFNFQRKSTCELDPLSFACVATNCDRRSYAEKIWRIVRALTRRSLIDLSRRRPTILAVHEGMVDYLVRGGINRDAIRVMRNSVSPWSDTRIVAEENAKFLFVGRLEHDKGADLLAAAARAAGVQLEIVGDGPLRADLARAYPEFRFTGWQSREQLATLARTVRTVVAPTASRETFGLVAFEALTSGIPVIVSKFGIAADEIVNNGLGFACDPYDHQELTRLLKQMAANNNELGQMSRACWERRDSISLTSSQWEARLLSLYEDAAKSA